METVGLSLKESEQSYYQELFSLYDKDNLGKVQGQQVTELFRSSQLSTEKLDVITELCGAKRLGHFGRSQFYVALKLVAAAQIGLPLKPETLSADVPLPTFTICQDFFGHKIDVGMVDGVNCVENNQYPVKNTQIKQQSFTAAVRDTDSQNSSPCEHLSKERNLWMSFSHEDGTLSDHDHLLGNEEGESSERHSSDDESEVWTINAEQETYYREQFAKMQPDLGMKISGVVAKDFFEKSKLPVQELSKIWQLSDIDKDGALSLAEFCTAMHLVVLRRNNINLPEKLPPSLVPKIPALRITEPKQQEAKSTSKPTSPSKQLSPQNKEWTKFQESPTSTVSSPGTKLVNFDFSAASVEQDPQILHPVAVRVTPDFHDGEIPVEPAFENQHQDPPLSIGITLTGLQGPKKEPPPPPPPRPRRNHARSSSLDLNRIGKSSESHFLHSGSHSTSIPPAVPPRVSPSSAGAFEVYRKPTSTSCQAKASSLSLDLDISESSHSMDPSAGESEKKRYMSAPTPGADALHEKRELQVSIKMHKERNGQLSRLNVELDQELSEIMAERIALEIQLEHMKNSASS